MTHSEKKREGKLQVKVSMTAIIASVLTGLITLSGIFYKSHRDAELQENQIEFYKQKILLEDSLSRQHQIELNKHQVELSLINGMQILDLMFDLNYRIKSDYIHIIQVHNGGGRLRPNTEQYLDILHESRKGERPKIKLNYKNIVLDAVTRKVFTESIMRPAHYVYIPDVNNDVLIFEEDSRQHFKMLKIKSIYVVYLGASDDGLYGYYLQASYPITDPDLQQNVFLNTSMQLAAQRIRELLNVSL